MIDFVGIAKTATAMSVLGGMAWGAADWADRRPVLENELIELKQLAGDLTDSVASLRFWALLDRAKINGSLTLDEQRELCLLAEQLHYTGIPGCPDT